ncbi:hypothetical protein SDC9_195529 [bioreactor metagenome]|uniref:Uncharacterized protein n=2 Tax=root TaxID=1 RepID=A0A645I9A4_9ZZZZ
MTLKEYLEDYASPETKELGEALIRRGIEDIPKEKVREIVRQNLINISNGSRDFRL